MTTISPWRHESWRHDPGSYLLMLGLDRATPVSTGRLGACTLAPGRYVYAGSALGPGGVAGRVLRHLRTDKRIHWHIDHLTLAAPITGVAAVYGTDRCECKWVEALAALPGVTVPIRGFGSSDCQSGCEAHLLRLPDDLPLSWIEDELTRCPIQAI